MQRCLRDVGLVRSQLESSIAYGSSWLGLLLREKHRLVSSLARYLAMMLRDSFVRQATSWVEILPQRFKRRITLNKVTSITPAAPARYVSGGW